VYFYSGQSICITDTIFKKSLKKLLHAASLLARQRWKEEAGAAIEYSLLHCKATQAKPSDCHYTCYQTAAAAAAAAAAITAR